MRERESLSLSGHKHRSKNVSAHMRIYIYINIVGSHGQAGRTDQDFILASCLNDEANARERA